MAGQIFISAASADRQAAEKLCAGIEAAGLSCWIASRDIPPGASYSRAILDAIAASRAMIVVLSSATSDSSHVLREVERAVDRRLPLMPVRIEDARPRDELEYFLSAVQWVDAFPDLRDDVLRRIVGTLRALIGSKPEPISAPLSDVPQTTEPIGAASHAPIETQERRNELWMTEAIEWSPEPPLVTPDVASEDGTITPASTSAPQDRKGLRHMAYAGTALMVLAVIVMVPRSSPVALDSATAPSEDVLAQTAADFKVVGDYLAPLNDGHKPIDTGLTIFAPLLPDDHAAIRWSSRTFKEGAVERWLILVNEESRRVAFRIFEAESGTTYFTDHGPWDTSLSLAGAVINSPDGSPDKNRWIPVYEALPGYHREVAAWARYIRGR